MTMPIFRKVFHNCLFCYSLPKIIIGILNKLLISLILIKKNIKGG